MALPNNLDGPHGHQTWAFTDELLDTLNSKTLWDEYGIDDDILVCKLSLLPFFSDSEIAFYSWLSTCWHPWNPNTWFVAPSYKRNLQRSSCHLGWQVPCPWTWRSTSKWDSQWHWPVVCFFFLLQNLTKWQYILELQQLHFFQIFIDFHMAVASNNGQGMIQRH